MSIVCPPFAPPSTDPVKIHNALLESYMDGTKRPDIKYSIAKDVTLDSNGHVPVAALQSKFKELQDAGFISSDRAAGQHHVSTVEDDIRKDRAFLAALEPEFCHYDSRFRFALERFLLAVTGNGASQMTTAQVNQMLSQVQTLNVRSIFINEFQSYFAQKRIPPAQADAKSIQEMNGVLNERLLRLRNAYTKFKDEKAIVVAQREMVRYTASKNAGTMSTVGMWVGANVLALCAIGAAYVYA